MMRDTKLKWILPIVALVTLIWALDLIFLRYSTITDDFDPEELTNITWELQQLPDVPNSMVTIELDGELHITALDFDEALDIFRYAPKGKVGDKVLV